MIRSVSKIIAFSLAQVGAGARFFIARTSYRPYWPQAGFQCSVRSSSGGERQLLGRTSSRASSAIVAAMITASTISPLPSPSRRCCGCSSETA